MSEAAVRVIADALRTAQADDQVRFFRLNINGEWGSFFLREGGSGEGERQQHWCELTCNTSFGTVGHYWGGMSRPAARFFASISSDYALGKLWGMGTDLYDEATARNNLKSYLLRERRDGNLVKGEARELWNELVVAPSPMSQRRRQQWIG